MSSDPKLNPGSELASEPLQPSLPSNTRIKGFAAGLVSGMTKLAVLPSLPFQPLSSPADNPGMQVGHPLDTVKIRRQISSEYSSSMDAFIQTVRHQGIRGLYAGATPPLVGWSISDPMLLGSLNIYRLHLASVEARAQGRDPDGIKGLSLPGHAVGFPSIYTKRSQDLISSNSWLAVSLVAQHVLSIPL